MVTARGLAEVVLMVEDIQKAEQFYRDVLGMRVISPNLGGPVFLQVGEDRTGVPHQIVLVPRPPDSAPLPVGGVHRNVHHIGIEIALQELEEARRRLENLGFEVRTGEHPFLPVEAIYLDDPDGNEIELVARR